jgi:hypothetical protein
VVPGARSVSQRVERIGRANALPSTGRRGAAHGLERSEGDQRGVFSRRLAYQQFAGKRARARRVGLQEVITESDLFTREELDRDAFQREFLDPFGLRWFSSFGATLIKYRRWCGRSSRSRRPHRGPLRASHGGLFLAFPAIFPASATLIEEHVRERKEKAGLPGARRGKEAAALDAAGAVLGSLGLAAFGLVIWLMIVQSPAWALVLAAASWLAVAVLGWQVRRWL